MSDVTWHEKMEDCPNEVPILIKYSDGEIRFEEAEENNCRWAKHYPMAKPYYCEIPVAWARVE